MISLFTHQLNSGAEGVMLGSQLVETHHAYLEEMLSFSSETYLMFPFWIYVITLPAARGSCVTRFGAIPTRSEFRHFRFQMCCLLL